MQCAHRIAAPAARSCNICGLCGGPRDALRPASGGKAYQRQHGSRHAAHLQHITAPAHIPQHDQYCRLLQGELDLSGRNVALLWDFDNLRPPGGARAAAHAVHLLQVRQSPLSGALHPCCWC